MTRTQLYSPPRIVSHGDDLRKRWHVVYYHLHPHTGQMQRLRIYADLARYTSKRHRSMAARRLRKAIAQALQEAWSPFGTVPAPGGAPISIADCGYDTSAYACSTRDRGCRDYPGSAA
jgi:hypothetical protein